MLKVSTRKIRYLRTFKTSRNRNRGKWKKSNKKRSTMNSKIAHLSLKSSSMKKVVKLKSKASIK